MVLSSPVARYWSSRAKGTANRLESKLGSVTVRTLFTVIIGSILIYFSYQFFFKEKEIETHVKAQWKNFYLITGPFQTYSVPLILFDIELLPHVFKPRGELWHDPAYTCRVLCKHHPEGRNVITFAALARKFIPQKDKLLALLKKIGFAIHTSQVPDPRLHDGDPVMIPTYLWLAKNDHLIHIALLHERVGNYYWAGPVTDQDWLETTKVLAPQMKHADWTVLDAAFPRSAQAYDMTHHLTGTATIIDNHKFIVPFHVSEFLKEYKESRFIECDHAWAKSHKERFPLPVTPKEDLFQMNAKKLLKRAKSVLDRMKIPFWISSGTLLGWFRECGIIPHSVDVDIGIWIHDYREDLIEQMENNGLMLKNKFGKVEDSLEISFLDISNVKLDIFFFYAEVDHAWNGGTRAYDAAKFKFIFPKFTLCWTEFVELKVRVPCETLSYIEANYGKYWDEPVKKWIWYHSPPNVESAGFWDRKEWDNVIQVYERTAKEKEKGGR